MPPEAKPAPGAGSELRAAARLVVEAVAGLAGVVEAVHANVARLPGAPPPASGRTRGLTALSYRAVRGVTRLVGGTVDAALALLEPALAHRIAGPGYEALRAALNGVIGDWLASRANPLAITMCLRSGGIALRLDPASLAQALPDARGRIVVLLHGLCMNDLQWARNGADFAAALARDLGVTPVHLLYNSGRHVGTNGRDFAQLMQALVRAWPVPLESIDLLAHSMGGLVARSALHQAELQAHGWPRLVRSLVFLGTPHHGAPLERGGQRLNQLLSLSPFTRPLMRIGEMRSAGITDLRFGHLLEGEGDGPAQEHFAGNADTRTPVPLPAGVQAFAVAGVTAASDASAHARFIGDGLVPLDSALGRHPDARQALALPAQRQWVALRTSHLQLQTSPQVYRRVKTWLLQPPAAQ